jgi:hypothetical protein
LGEVAEWIHLALDQIQWWDPVNMVMNIWVPPVPVAALSKARTVFDRSNSGIAGSNPTRGMDVCLRVFCVMFSCVGRGVASG